MKRTLNLLFLTGILGVTSALTGGILRAESPVGSKRIDSPTVFERRILPIFKSASPSTCSECHLSGVDLKDYIRPSEGETFASLLKQGLIDAKKPDKSRLLKLIRMSTPKSALLTKAAREREYEAFREWIETSVKNAKLAGSPILKIGSSVSNKVIRHTRIDSVVDSFTRNIWSQEGRCMGCHRPGTAENEGFYKQYGERVRWFVPDDPEATMRKILAQKLVDLENPGQSLLLLKPMNKAPHGGGEKFVENDTTYRMFRGWIDDYVKSVKGNYLSEKDLPEPPKVGLAFTQSILEINQAPESWIKKSLTVEIYAWNASAKDWEPKPIATGDREVGENRATNVLVFRIFPMGGPEEKAAWKQTRLTSGSYLLKYFLNTDPQISKNVPANSPAYYQGKQEIASDWKTGWGGMTHVAVKLKAGK